MDILIDSLRISGFRGISNLELNLSMSTILIGTNNSGKTSILKALQLAMGDYGRFITGEDFHISKDETISESIIVDYRIVPTQLTPDEGRAPRAQFNDEWLEEFGDKIQATPDGNQFLGVRTVCEKDDIKGGYSVSRYALSRWPEFTKWTEEKTNAKNKITSRFEALPFVPIEAQRDIHSELKEKKSIVGKVLSSIKFDKKDTSMLEGLIKKLNEKAIASSNSLERLRANLENLNQSFSGSGKAEVTPFPKKIRDLSKKFTVHFGENDNLFSMEYHGMGTRSWASLLSVKAFTQLMIDSFEGEEKPIFPIIAAEEPEAHLHPNAQRQIYTQLTNIPGQIIFSSHSPYLASLAEIDDIRVLSQINDEVKATSIMHNLDSIDKKIISREVLRLRGEVLFSKALILFEGVTEEQLIPAMFEKYFECSPYKSGINCISVGGQNYRPYIKIACSLNIPVYIVSDSDKNVQTEVKAQINKLKRDDKLSLTDDVFGMSFLAPGNDFESELIKVLKLTEEAKESLLYSSIRGEITPQHRAAKKKKIAELDDDSLLSELRNNKAAYSGFMADVISENSRKKSNEELIPVAVRNAFDKIKEWCSPC